MAFNSSTPARQLTEPTRLDLWLDFILGPDWHLQRGSPERLLESTEAIEDRLIQGTHRLKTNSNAPGNPRYIDGFREVTDEVLIGPQRTVFHHYASRGTHLSRPSLPCLKVTGMSSTSPNVNHEHGVRGTSRRSRARQLATGGPCWGQGLQNYDLIPLELVDWVPVHPDRPRSTNAQIRCNTDGRPRGSTGDQLRSDRQPMIGLFFRPSSGNSLILPSAWFTAAMTSAILLSVCQPSMTAVIDLTSDQSSTARAIPVYRWNGH